jgi:hypothetical protein
VKAPRKEEDEMPSNTTTCRVCSRPLRTPLSIAQGVGPKCGKKVRQAMQAILDQVRQGEGVSHAQSLYALSPDELQRVMEQNVREAYLAQMRQRRRPIRIPVRVEVDSDSRSCLNEPTTVTWIDADHAVVESDGGGRYETTNTSCTCPHFLHRLSRDPERAAEGCRHMQAMRLARQQVAQQRRERRRQARQEPVLPVEVHEENRLTFAQIDWTEEAQREEVLNIWRQNRVFDGIYMSRDEQAWQTLQERAGQDWDYQYENVLGGTGVSFGVELEVEFDSQSQRTAALNELYQEQLTFTNQMQGYHSEGRSGFWKAERDGSLGSYGVEIVSPVLYDTPDNWKQIEKATEILRRHGAKTTNRCGGHIHVGIAPLDHRTYSWQRLARIGVGFERQFYRMGGANSESYRQSGQPGQHRGSSYAKPLEWISFGGNAEATAARRQISSERYKIFNTTNIDHLNPRLRKPAVEMRYPNGSIDHRQIQAQIQVANAVVHQAAAIRNDSPQSEFTPRFSETSRHLRYRDRSVSTSREEANFREFLDVLGNPHDRLAATWLWVRGKAE